MIASSTSSPKFEATPSVLYLLFGEGALLITSSILAVIAVAAILFASAARKEVRAKTLLAQSQLRKLNQMRRTVHMAETIAELGVWHYNPATGEQEWSRGMKAIFGIDDDEPFVEGDAETLLFANNVDLVGSVLLQRAETDTYNLEFDIIDRLGAPRSILVQAYNLRHPSGGIANVVGVVRDVTDQLAHQRDLEHSREKALVEARQARELAETDPLTGLANRRRVMAKLDQYLMQARRKGAGLSMILFDLDHFKAVNDTYGHPEGDKVLQKVGEIALAQARASDLVGRVGGEEFVWIVEGADQKTAHSLADRLRRAIALQTGEDGTPDVTASVGCAQMQPGDSSLTIFSRADRALYAAKDGGRNQVRLAA